MITTALLRRSLTFHASIKRFSTIASTTSATAASSIGADFKPDAKTLKTLRERSMGLSLQDCRRALVATKGDIELAFDILVKENLAKGNASLLKRGMNEAKNGSWFVLSGPNVNSPTTLLQVLCETDFVAKNQGFIGFGRQIASSLHKANQNQETSISHIMSKDLNETSLNEEKKVNEFLTEWVGRLGEKIVLNQAIRITPKPFTSVASYVHGNTEHLTEPGSENITTTLGNKYAGFIVVKHPKTEVLVEKSETKLLNQLVQHLVGCQPENDEEFLGQPFLFNEETSVKQVLEGAGWTLESAKWFGMNEIATTEQ